MTCENAPPSHFHYCFWLQLTRDEIYVKNPVVYKDRKVARRAGARDVGRRVMVLKCDGPSSQGPAG